MMALIPVTVSRLLMFFFLVGGLIVYSTEALNFYDFTVIGPDGSSSTDLSAFRGKVSLVTNVASYCGYTSEHYIGYAELLKEFAPHFHILAFPCNQFGEQEPEDLPTIQRNIGARYSADIIFFNKINVIGNDVPAAWQYLIDESKTAPAWNFNKYLVDADGLVRGAWSPHVAIDDIRPAIREAIQQIHKRNEL